LALVVPKVILATIPCFLPSHLLGGDAAAFQVLVVLVVQVAAVGEVCMVDEYLAAQELLVKEITVAPQQMLTHLMATVTVAAAVAALVLLEAMD
jgi:hypothetical protein